MTRHRQHRRTSGRAVSTLDTAAGSSAAALPPLVAGRIAAVDAVRGIAIVLMIVYHFCFDLRFFGVTRWDFEHDPFWLGFRGLIVTMFMLLVGISLVLAERAGMSKQHFWRRVAVIVACAMAATAGSYFLFPRSFIYFGILLAVAVSSILAWPLVRRPMLAAAIGVVIVVAGVILSHSLFDARPLSWMGFTTKKPETEDYVPLAPWFGVACLGVVLGHLLVQRRFRELTLLAKAPQWLQWCGRHSLAIYMAHQPLLLGVLWLALRR